MNSVRLRGLIQFSTDNHLSKGTTMLCQKRICRTIDWFTCHRLVDMELYRVADCCRGKSTLQVHNSLQCGSSFRCSSRYFRSTPISRCICPQYLVKRYHEIASLVCLNRTCRYRCCKSRRLWRRQFCDLRNCASDWQASDADRPQCRLPCLFYAVVAGRHARSSIGHRQLLEQ